MRPIDADELMKCIPIEEYCSRLAVANAPTIDLSDYSDRLWKKAYEQGKADAESERKKGKWVPHREMSREYIGSALVSIRYDYWFCDTCGYRVEDGQPMYNFCPNCGAKMEKEEDNV